MTVVTYEFTLPEDADELKLFESAPKRDMALNEVVTYLRSVNKYGDPSCATPDVIYARVLEICAEEGVDPWE